MSAHSKLSNTNSSETGSEANMVRKLNKRRSMPNLPSRRITSLNSLETFEGNVSIDPFEGHVDGDKAAGNRGSRTSFPVLPFLRKKRSKSVRFSQSMVEDVLNPETPLYETPQREYGSSATSSDYSSPQPSDSSFELHTMQADTCTSSVLTDEQKRYFFDDNPYDSSSPVKPDNHSKAHSLSEGDVERLLSGHHVNLQRSFQKMLEEDMDSPSGKSKSTLLYPQTSCLNVHGGDDGKLKQPARLVSLSSASKEAVPDTSPPSIRCSERENNEVITCAKEAFANLGVCATDDYRIPEVDDAPLAEVMLAMHDLSVNIRDCFQVNSQRARQQEDELKAARLRLKRSEESFDMCVSSKEEYFKQVQMLEAIGKDRVGELTRVSDQLKKECQRSRALDVEFEAYAIQLGTTTEIFESLVDLFRSSMPCFQDEEYRDLNLMVRTLLDQFSCSKEEVALLKQSKTGLGAEIQALQVSLASKNTEIAMLEEKWGAEKDKVQSLQATLEKHTIESNETQAGLISDISDITSELESMRVELKQDLDSKDQRISALSAELATSFSKHQELRNQIVSQDKSIRDLKASVGEGKLYGLSIERELEKALIEVSAEQDGQRGLRNTISTQEKEIRELQRQVESMRHEGKQRSLEHDKTKALLESENTARHEISAEKVALEEDLKQSSIELTQSKSSISVLEKKVTSLEWEVKEQRNEHNEKLSAIHSRHQSTLASKETLVSKLEERSKFLESGLSAGKDALARLQGEYEAVRAEYDSTLQQHKSEMDSTIESHAEELASLKSQADQAMAFIKDEKQSLSSTLQAYITGYDLSVYCYLKLMAEVLHAFKPLTEDAATDMMIESVIGLSLYKDVFREPQMMIMSSVNQYILQLAGLVTKLHLRLCGTRSEFEGVDESEIGYGNKDNDDHIQYAELRDLISSQQEELASLIGRLEEADNQLKTLKLGKRGVPCNSTNRNRIHKTPTFCSQRSSLGSISLKSRDRRNETLGRISSCPVGAISVDKQSAR